MKKTTKKLSFSAETVRQLQQSISDEQLPGVAGGTLSGGLIVQKTLNCYIAPRPPTAICPSVNTDPVAC